MSDRGLLLHLYRRAGFGATPHELDAASSLGFAEVVDRLLGGLDAPEETVVTPPTFDGFAADVKGNDSDHGAELLALTNWWIDEMASTTSPLKEKLVLLLHCQFPTAYYKVNVPSLLYRQNQLFRVSGRARFDALVGAVSKDPAMLLWLDAASNLLAHPNQNFARELFERFTMGVGNYSEHDVDEAARAFTGWQLSFKTGDYALNAAEHDYGLKDVLGHRGDLSGEDVIDIVTRTRASSHFVTSRFWSWLGYPATPDERIVRELAAGYKANLRLGTLLRSILTHPEFVSDRAVHGLVKQPVEYVVGVLRAFGLRSGSFSSGYLMGILTSLGQQLFNPPTVGGWGANEFWLSTATSLTQLHFASTVTQVADLSAIEGAPQSRRVQALERLLGVDTFTAATRSVLDLASSDPSLLVTLALVTPEYLAN